MVVWIVVAIALIVVGVVIWHKLRLRKRRASLRKTDNGWEWTEFDGSTKRSSTHPEERGGAWYSEGHSDSGDSGGDGGGGGD